MLWSQRSHCFRKDLQVLLNMDCAFPALERPPGAESSPLCLSARVPQVEWTGPSWEDLQAGVSWGQPCTPAEWAPSCSFWLGWERGRGLMQTRDRAQVSLGGPPAHLGEFPPCAFCVLTKPHLEASSCVVLND